MRIHLVRGDGHHIDRTLLIHGHHHGVYAQHVDPVVDGRSVSVLHALIDDLYHVIVGNLRNVIDLMRNLKNNVEPYRADSFPMMVYYDEDATLENDEFPKLQEELKSMGIEELLSYYTTAYENYMAAKK